MTQAEKLEALVRRAIKRGWDYPNHDHLEKVSYPDDGKVRRIAWHVDDVFIFWVALEYMDDDVPNEWRGGAGWKYECNTIIFNHDFARALFGETEICFECTELRMENDYLVNSEYGCDNEDYYEHHKTGKAFHYHLQQAVIGKDPIGYMYEVVYPQESKNNK